MTENVESEKLKSRLHNDSVVRALSGKRLYDGGVTNRDFLINIEIVPWQKNQHQKN